jgi:cytochrome P450
MGPWRLFLLFHPEYVRHVLQDAHHKYVKGALVARSRPLIGNGLFSSEGDFWRRQRRLAQPAFHRQRIEAFAGTMAEATSAMLERWESHAAGGVAFDVAEEMSALTLGIVGRTLFSMDLSGDAADVGQAMLGALDFLNRQGTSFFYLPVGVPTPGNLRFLRARRILDRVVYGIIETRRRTADRERRRGLPRPTPGRSGSGNRRVDERPPVA